MQLTSHRHLNKIAKGALAVVLAGSFTFSASKAFADGTTNKQDQSQTVDLQTGTNAEANPTVQTAQTQETPSLLPGDFFYFAKTAFEKIQLALTFKDVKEAKLLADFASERLTEAQALFASGDQETAIETIDQALEDMKDADKIVKSQTQSDSSANEVNNDTFETKTEEQSASAQKQSGEQATTETFKDHQAVSEVQNRLTQNMIALTAAVDKVKNPTAKAALEKNINKSYAKLAKKLENITARLAKKKNKEAGSEGEQAPVSVAENESVSTNPSVTINSNTATANANSNINENVSGDTEAAQTRKMDQQRKQGQQEVNQVRQAAKEEVKQTQQAAKEQVHQKREEAKTLMEEKKAEAKQKADVQN